MKKLIAVIIATGLASALAGCGSSKSQSSSGISSKAAAAALTQTPTSILPSSFLFYYDDTACADPASSNCPSTRPSAAVTAVQRFKDIGIGTIMMINQDPVANDTLPRAIRDAGLRFYSHERPHLERAINPSTNRFDCSLYASRIRDLKRLKAEFGDTFSGFNLFDEPSIQDAANLASLKNCLMSEAEFAGMETFVNLYPFIANAALINGQAVTSGSSTYGPSDFGIGCTTGDIPDSTAFSSIYNRYRAYAEAMTKQVGPTYLAYDYYPFTQDFDSCFPFSQMALTNNLSIVKNATNGTDTIPVSYLQNYNTYTSGGGGIVHSATSTQLLWFSATSHAFGIRYFADFVSHTVADGSQAGAGMTGLLGADNQPTGLYSAIELYRVWMKLIENELSTYRYIDFVSASFAVPSGDIIASSSNPGILIGEFENPESGSIILSLAKQNPLSTRSTAALQLKQSFSKFERLNLETGRWEIISLLTSRSLAVSVDTYPVSIYRLSKSGSQ